MPDKPVKGVVKVTKIDALTGEKCGPGFVFDIYAAEDIKDGSKAVRAGYSRGEKVDTITTGNNTPEDDDSTAVSKPLYLGKYTIRESKASDGFVISDKTYDITITENTASKTALPVEIRIPDTPSQMRVLKVDEDGEKALEGVVYRITRKEDTAYYSSEAPVSTGDVRKQHLFVTDKDGYINVRYLAHSAIYTVQEISPAPGYNMDETIYEFTTDDRGYVNGELLYTMKLTNRPNRLHVSKIDATNSREVPGARLVLTDENGRVMDEWVSTETPHLVTGLKAGIYHLNELFDRINAKRRENGLNELIWDSGYGEIAGIRSIETSVYFTHILPSSDDGVKGLRFIGVNDEYGISQEGEAVVAFKGAREGSGTVSVHTRTDRFGVPENFDTSCSYTIEKAYLETALTSDHESADIYDMVTDTVESTLMDDLSGLTLHYAPDTYTAPKTLTPLAGLDGATITVTHASGKSAAMPLSGAVDLSGYHGITDVTITAASSAAGSTVRYSVSYGFATQDADSVTNRAVSEARNGRDVVKYADSVTIPVTRCIVGNPSAVYAGEAAPFGRDALVSFLGVELSATQVSSDYSYEITTPDFIPLKTVTLPVLTDGTGMQVLVYPAGSKTPTDLGMKAGGESIELNEKVSKIVLIVPAQNMVFSTQQQGMLTFSNTERENRERFFKIRVNARTSYRSTDEVVEKTFESAGIPLELYRPEAPEEAKDPDIKPIENPDSNKGSEDIPKTPETEEEETQKEDKEREKKEKEREDLRKAQDAAELRSLKRAELRDRISKIRQLAISWKSVTLPGRLAGDASEGRTESNTQRIARIKGTNLALSKLSDEKAAMVRSMMVSRDLSDLYRKYGLYPIPETIVEMNERTHYGKTLDLYRQKGLISISDQVVDQGDKVV